MPTYLQHDSVLTACASSRRTHFNRSPTPLQVELSNVYNISHLGDKELMEAAEAQAFYVHGFHGNDILVHPRQLNRLLKAVKDMRWQIQTTGEFHSIDEETPVVKLVTENKNKPLYSVFKIKTHPRRELGKSIFIPGTRRRVRKLMTCIFLSSGENFAFPCIASSYSEVFLIFPDSNAATVHESDRRSASFLFGEDNGSAVALSTAPRTPAA